MEKQVVFKTVAALLLAATVRADSVSNEKPANGRPDPAKEIFLATAPSVAPDGSFLVFEWCNRLWKAPLADADAPITALPLTDVAQRADSPVVSPDGKRVAFRAGHETNSFRVFELSLSEPSAPRQISFHSEPTFPCGYTADGSNVCAMAVRDSYDVRAGRKPILIPVSGKGGEMPLVDVRCEAPSVSPDGKKVLFVRFGDIMYRKRRGTSSPSTGQIWCYDRAGSNFTCVVNTGDDAASPHWLPDGSGFIYTRASGGIRNLRIRKFGGADVQLTRYTDDHVLTPSLSADGTTVVYRHGFGIEMMKLPASLLKDPVTFKPGSLRATPLQLVPAGGVPVQLPARNRYTTATNVDEPGKIAFSADGSQIAFTAGGALWAMDAVIRQPKRVFASKSAFVRDCAFSPDAKAIYLIADRGTGTDVWRVRRGVKSRAWWENTGFFHTRLLSDSEGRTKLSVSPDGTMLAWGDCSGNVSIASTNGTLLARLPRDSMTKSYVWHPTSRMIAFAQRDNVANTDIWLARLPDLSNAKGRPVEIAKSDCQNVSRHWAWDGTPTFSPDGKLLAFAGERPATSLRYDYCLFYVYLDAADEQAEAESLKQLEEARKAGEPTSAKKKPAPASSAPVLPPFDARLHERLRCVRMPNAAMTPFFSHDSRTLAFTSQSQVSTIHIPNRLKPTKRLGVKATVLGWIKNKDTILGVVDQVPAVNEKKLTFSVQTERSRADLNELAFRMSWGMLRDFFYDPALHGADWQAVFDAYQPYARHAPSADVLARLFQKMLGELDSSHLGFTMTAAAESDWGRWSGNASGWREQTFHLGLGFVPDADGWRVTRLLPDTPLTSQKGHPEVGDVILLIDGRPVSSGNDPARLLTVAPGHRFRVVFRHGASTNATLAAGISYDDARAKECDLGIAARRERVHEATGGKVGYIHVKRMNPASLREFEDAIYAEGMDKEALIVDVRDNGGGNIAERLLEILCAPIHASFRFRTGVEWGRGDLRDRHRPMLTDVKVVVLVNQWSASNSEIFTHAIKSLKRGIVVGTPTAGAVIGTSSQQILGYGTMRKPHVWWRTAEGMDMEHHPAVPDVPVALTPADEAAGRDPQLEKAIELSLK